MWTAGLALTGRTNRNAGADCTNTGTRAGSELERVVVLAMSEAGGSSCPPELPCTDGSSWPDAGRSCAAIDNGAIKNQKTILYEVRIINPRVGRETTHTCSCEVIDSQ